MGSRDTIELIRDRLPIEELCEMHGIAVSHSGRCLCPFHDDHNPSASAKDGYFRCWTCMDKSVDIFGFIQKMHGESFLEALTRLGKITGVNVDLSQTDEIEIEIDAIEKATLRKCHILLDRELRQLYKESPVDFWGYIYLMAKDAPESEDVKKLLKKATEYKNEEADFFLNREIRIR